MILNRLVAELREQNWLGVVLEILIVAVGIVLALQVDNWNEGRKERGLEQAYLLRLTADIQADIDGFQNLRRIFKEKFEFVRAIESGVSSEQIENEPGLWMQRLRYSLYISLPSVRSATFDELAGSGQLTILKDLALRSALANYYAEYALISGILAQPIGDYKILVYENFPGALLYMWRTTESLTTTQEVLEGLEILRVHREFKSAANAELAYAGDLVRYCDEFIRMGEQLLSLIAMNLKNPSAAGAA